MPVMRISLATLTIALFLALPAAAQWRNLPNNVPLGADGKPNLSAPTPRTASGKPDLSGIYTPNYRYFQNLAADIGLENVPMTSGAQKIHAARATGLLGYDEPDAHCLPQGVPKINQAPVPFKIVQTDTLVLLVYEAFNLWRQVHLDGRDFAEDLNPSWMGFSKGRWEGDTLVVETTNFHPNGNAMGGLFRFADQNLRLTERFTRTGAHALTYEFTVDDPTIWTRPWTAMVPWTSASGDIYEYACHEGNYSLANMLSAARFEENTPEIGPR